MKMKTVVVLTLLIATVYCLPMKRSASSSESSEERAVAQQPAPVVRKAAAEMVQAEPTQTTPAESNESTDSADDTEDADDDSGTDNTDSSESESEEAVGTMVPATEEPTLDPFINTGRGDSLGYPEDYKKSSFYVDGKYYEKLPSPYKSYGNDKMDDLGVVSKKTSAFDDQHLNDVVKGIKLHKALNVHADLLEEEDTSTPEIILGENEIAPVGGQDNEGASAGDSSSASASQEETDNSPSNETTETPGGPDSDDESSQSTESQESDEDTLQTPEPPVVIAK